MNDASWMEEGLCRETDPNAFLPEQNSSQAEAKAICNSPCIVKTQCLIWALERGEKGIWGGTNDKQRRQLRKGAA